MIKSPTQMEVRTTIKLNRNQADLLKKLSEALDIDQGKVTRWTFDLMESLVKSKHYQLVRDDMNPKEKYLLDTIKSCLT